MEAVSDDLRLEQARIAAIKGRRAKAIVEDEVFLDAFARIERDTFDRWRNSALSDVDRREQAFRLLAVIGAAKQKLVETIMDGAIAEAELAQANQEPGVIKTYTAG